MPNQKDINQNAPNSAQNDVKGDLFTSKLMRGTPISEEIFDLPPNKNNPVSPSKPSHLLRNILYGSVLGVIVLLLLTTLYFYRAAHPASKTASDYAATSADIAALTSTKASTTNGYVVINGNANVNGSVTADNFNGNGADLSNVNATRLNSQPGSYYQNADNIDAGVLSDARLSGNVALLDASQTFSGSNVFSGSNSFANTTSFVNLLISGSTTASGAVTITNNLTVTGDTIVGGTLGVNGLAYSWPGTQANGILANDGAGNLAWQPVGACANCITDGGNAFGSAISIGTNDANALTLRTNGSNRLTIDTAGLVGIGNPTPTYALDVNGDVNLTTGNAFRIGGTAICTSGGCAASAGSTDYVQNSASLQTGVNFNFEIASINSVGGIIRAKAGQVADLQQWQSSGGVVLAYVDANGDVSANAALKINGTTVCTASGCTAAGGSGVYIQNGTALQTTANFNIQSAAAGSVGGVIRGAVGQSANLQEWQDSSGSALSYVDSSGNIGVDHTGKAILRLRSTNSDQSELIFGSGTSNMFFFDPVGGGIRVYVNASERARFNTTGTFQVNSPTNTVGTAEKFRVNTPTTVDNLANVIFGTSATTTKGLVVQGLASQTADLQEWQDSTGAIFGKVTAAGSLQFTATGNNPSVYGNSTSDNGIEGHSSSTSASKASIVAQPLAAGSRGVIVKGFTGQTANLQEWQDSTGVVLSSITASGALSFGTTPASAGSIRLPNATSISWRNAANTADKSITLSSANVTDGLNLPGNVIVGGSDATAGALYFFNSGVRILRTAASGIQLITAGTTGIALNSSGQVGINPATNTFTGGTVERLRVNTPTTVDNLANVIFSASAATSKPLVIQGAAGQTANLQEWQSSTGTVLSGIDASGNLLLGSASSATGSAILYNSGGAGSITLTGANPGVSSYTITFPAETGTVCTTATSGACTSAGGFVQLQASTPGTAQTGNLNLSGVALAGTAVTVGTNAAAAGAVRLPNATNISFRNAANSADLTVVSVDASNVVNFANSGSQTGVVLGTPAGGTGYTDLQAASGIRFRAAASTLGQFVNTTGQFQLFGLSANVPKFSVNTATTTDSLANVIFSTDTTTSKALVIQGKASQTANLQEWQTSAGVAPTYIDSSGLLFAKSTGIKLGFNQKIQAEYSSGGSFADIAWRGASNDIYLGAGADVHLGYNSTYTTIGSGGWRLYSSDLSNASTGSNSIGATGAVGQIFITSPTSTVVPQTIKAGVSQTADLTQWKNSGGVVMTAVQSGGSIAFGATPASTGVIRFTGTGSYDGLYWRNTGNTADIAGITSDGTNLIVGQSGASTLFPGLVRVSSATGTNGSVEKLRVNTPTTVDNLANVIFSTSATTSKGLVIQGTASQSANLQEWQDSTGAVKSLVDSSGRIVVGSSMNSIPAAIGINNYTTTSNDLVIQHGDSFGGIVMVNYGTPGGNFGGKLTLGHADGTIASPTQPGSGRIVGTVNFNAWESGSSFQNVASIQAAVDAGSGTGDWPGRLVFNTTPDGSTTPAERMRIDNAGNIYIGNGATSATPTSGVLGATGGAGTNIAGANLTLAGGRGTGTGVGGNIVFQYAAAGTSGGAANTLTAACTISGTNGSLSCPGAGASSEHFGASSQATGTSGLAIGNSAISANNGIAIGAGAFVFGTNGIAIGTSSVAGQLFTAKTDNVALGYSAFANGNFGVALGSTSSTAAFDYAIAIGAGATNTSNNQMVVGSNTAPINSGYFGNGVTNVAPAGFTLNSTGGSGSNIAGANITFAGGISTGSANGGALNFQTSKASGSGSSANSLSTIFSLSGGIGAATFQNTTDGTGAFIIKDSAGTNNIVNIDTTNDRVAIGTGTANPTVTLDVLSAGADASTVASFRNAGATSCTVQPGGTGFACSSDARLKTNIMNLDTTNAADIVTKLQGVSFNWITSPNGQAQDGFIAQDLQKLIPSAVSVGPNGYLVANYQAIIPYLVEAFKQQQTDIDTLKSSQVGQAQFNGGIVLNNTEFKGQAIFDALTTFKGKTVFSGDATFSGDITVNADGAGKTTIAAGAQQITVTFSHALATVPVVTATPEDFIDGQYKVTNITTTGFSIVTSLPQTQAARFNWTSIQKQ